MGCGGHKTGTKASGIYLVEPKYFDNHKNKAMAPDSQMKRKCGKSTNMRRGQKQKTGILAIARNELDPVSDGTDDGEDGPRIQPSISKAAVTMHVHLSLLSGESAAMDVDHGENIPLPDTEHTPSTHDPSPKSYLPVSANISDIEYEFVVMDCS